MKESGIIFEAQGLKPNRERQSQNLSRFEGYWHNKYWHRGIQQSRTEQERIQQIREELQNMKKK